MQTVQCKKAPRPQPSINNDDDDEDDEDDEEWRCKRCHMSFLHRSSVLRHERLNVCHQPGYRQYVLKRKRGIARIRAQQQEMANKLLKCPNCTAVFALAGSLRRHMKLCQATAKPSGGRSCVDAAATAAIAAAKKRQQQRQLKEASAAAELAKKRQKQQKFKEVREVVDAAIMEHPIKCKNCHREFGKKNYLSRHLMRNVCNWSRAKSQMLSKRKPPPKPTLKREPQKLQPKREPPKRVPPKRVPPKREPQKLQRPRREPQKLQRPKREPHQQSIVKREPTKRTKQEPLDSLSNFSPFKCPKCPVVFKARAYMERHLRKKSCFKFKNPFNPTNGRFIKRKQFTVKVEPQQKRNDQSSASRSNSSTTQEPRESEDEEDEEKEDVNVDVDGSDHETETEEETRETYNKQHDENKQNEQPPQKDPEYQSGPANYQCNVCDAMFVQMNELHEHQAADCLLTTVKWLMDDVDVE